MAICVQNEVVRDGVVPNCPRLAGIEVEKCITKCRYCRGYGTAVSHVGEYKKGMGWPRQIESFTTVTCDYHHTNEWCSATS